MQASAMVCLIVATSLSFASTSNTTLLVAYTRHAVEASQNISRMVADKAGTVTEQQVPSDHFRLGRHTRLLNENLDTIEKAILADEDRFVNGDWSKQIANLQARLNAMGYKATLQNPSATKRAAALEHIKDHGLKGYLGLVGAAVEQQGANFVSRYSYYLDPMTGFHARLVPAILPVCWLDIAGDMFAVGAISLRWPARNK